MSVEDERKLCIVVRSIYKAVSSKRKQLSDLYQKFVELEDSMK